MAEELIDQYVDRAKFASDTEFIQDQLKLVYSAYDKLSKVKVDLGKATNGAEVAKNAELGIKATIKLREETKAYTQAIAARFSTEAKLQTVQTNYAVQTTKNRVELQKTNAELKASAAAELAVIGSRERAVAQIKKLTLEKDKLNLINEKERQSYDKIVEKIEKYNKFLKETGTSAEKQKMNIGNYSGAVKTLETSLQEVVRKMDTMNKEGKENSAIYQQLNKEYELLNRLLNAQQAGFASAASEIRENTKALIQLEQAGLKNTETYRNLAKQTGELKDQIGDIKTATANLGSDTFVLDGMVEAAQGLAGAYGAALGAAELFGDENEDLQKTFVKLQAVMTVIQGLQALQNSLQKENSALLLLQDIRMKALTISQTVYAVAVGTSTGAMKAFRIALLATGIGAIIVAIGLAVEAMSEFADSTEDATENLEKQKEALDKYKQSLKEVTDESERARNRQRGNLNDLKRELELAEARGASERTILALKTKIFQAEQFNLKVRLSTFKGVADEEAEISEELKDLENKFAADKAEFQKKMREKALEAYKKSKKEQEDIEKRDFEASFKITEQNLQERSRLFLKDAESEKLSLQERLEALQRYKETQDQLLEAQKNYAKSRKDLTKNEQEAIDNEFTINSNKILEEYFEKRKEIIKNRSEEVAEIFRQTYENLNKAADKAFGQKSLDNEALRLEQLKALDEDFTAGRIKSYEAYVKAKDDLNSEYDRIAIEEELKHQEELLQIQLLFGEDTLDTERRILDLRKQLYDEDAANYDEAAQKKKKAEEDLKALKEKVADEAQALFTNIVIGQYEREKNLIQGQVDQIEIRKQKEIEAVNASILSEQEKADKIFIINQRAQSQKEELERRKRQLDYEAAVFNRAVSIAEIIANTGRAVMEAAPNPALVGFTIALGALQLGNVLARPIPRFKDGLDKDYEGFAIVGDGGKNEVHVKSDGSAHLTPARDTLTYVSKGDRIYPSYDDWVNSTINAAFGDADSFRPSAAAEKSESLKKEFQNLGKIIKNKKEVHFESGFNSMMAVHKIGDWWTSYVNEQINF